MNHGNVASYIKVSIDQTFSFVSYAKSIHLENISPQYIPCQQLKPAFHSSHLSCNMPYGSVATI